MTDPSNVVPFGKYKGRLIEELLVDDPGYVEWLAGQEWFRAKFTVLHQVIINRGAEPEETPEHNAMQVRFLDDEFCRRFLRNFVDLSPTTLINEAGAFYLIGSDSGIDSYQQTAVQNAGTIRKTGGTGTSDLGATPVPLDVQATLPARTEAPGPALGTDAAAPPRCGTHRRPPSPR